MAKRDAVAQLRDAKNTLKRGIRRNRPAGRAVVLVALNNMVSAASDLERARIENTTWIELVWGVGLLGQSAAQPREVDRLTSQQQALSAIEDVLGGLK